MTRCDSEHGLVNPIYECNRRFKGSDFAGIAIGIWKLELLHSLRVPFYFLLPASLNICRNAALVQRNDGGNSQWGLT